MRTVPRVLYSLDQRIRPRTNRTQEKWQPIRTAIRANQIRNELRKHGTAAVLRISRYVRSDEPIRGKPCLWLVQFRHGDEWKDAEICASLARVQEWAGMQNFGMKIRWIRFVRKVCKVTG